MFKWYVLNYNSNNKCVEQFNIFDNWILDEAVQKEIKKYLRAPSKYKFEKYHEEPIYGFNGLCEEIRRDIMWQEWGRYEYEISVGKPFENSCNNLEKWDCYEQCEKNIEAITRECIYQYKQNQKGNK